MWREWNKGVEKRERVKGREREWERAASERCYLWVKAVIYRHYQMFTGLRRHNYFKNMSEGSQKASAIGKSHEDSKIQILKVTDSDTCHLGEGDLQETLIWVGKATP